MRVRFIPVFLFLAAAVPSAQALVPASLRVQKLFADAGQVFSAKVTAVNPDRPILDIAPETKIKGTLPAAPMKLFLKDVPDARKLLNGLKAGDHVAVLLLTDAGGTATGGMLHAADTWLRIAPPGPGGKVWLTARDVVLPGSFPGKTATLELFLKDLADGKDKYLNDELDAHGSGLATPALSDAGSLGVKPTAVSAGKCGGKSALLVKSDAGEQAFVWNGKGFEKGGGLFQADLPLAKEAAKFAAPGAAVLTADWLGKPGAFVLTAEKISLFALDEDKPADAIDFTGIHQPKRGQKIIAAAAGDLNGDGRPDLYLAMDDGNDWVVINRGYGCFFPHNQPTLIRRKDWSVGGKPVPMPAFVAVGDFGSGRTDVLYISADGGVTALLKPFVK